MSLRARVLALGLLFCAGSVAPAQEPVDADYRLLDEVTVRDRARPLRGTILSGSEPGSAKLRMRLESGIELEIPRSDVLRILPRETPEKAFKARAKRIAAGGSAEDHRRLAEWGHGLGLTRLALGEISAAIAAEGDAKRRLEHRVRRVELLEQLAGELAAPEQQPLYEAILAQSDAAESFAPRIAIAHARVLLALGLPRAAVPLLQKARDVLRQRAGLPEDGGGATEAPADGGSEGTEGDAEQSGGTVARPPRRLGRGGAPLPPRRGGAGGAEAAEDGRGGGVPAEPRDGSAQALPNLDEHERRTYRDLLAALGRALDEAEDPDGAREAYGELLRIWPQDREATLAQAPLLAAAGRRAAAIDAVTQTLAVFPRDPELLLLRGRLHYLARHDAPAQADLTAAQEAAAKVPDLLRRVQVALAWVHIAAGRAAQALPLAEAADAPPPGYGPARLAKGAIAELGGDVEAAAQRYAEAERLLGPSAAEAAYCRSFALAKRGDAEGAERALALALRRGYSFLLAVRALVDLARARDDGEEEARLLELLCRSSTAPAPDELTALARVYLRQERLSEAQELLERARAAAPGEPDVLRGLAYCAYVRDDRPRARALFEQLLRLDADDSWARRGLRNLEEARTRRVWEDRFDRSDGELLNGWRVEAPFGIDVSLRNGKLRLWGDQKNEPGGKTLVSRDVQGERVVKFEVRLALDGGNVGRVGVRLHNGAATAVLFVDPADGRVKMATARGKQGFSNPADLGSWPGPGAHTLAIDVEDPRKGEVAFAIDGEVRARARLPGVASGRRRTTLAVYGQGLALGDAVRAFIERARVYVLRPPTPSGDPRRGGF
ncbi:MAG: hypothetical protein D6731_12745 [Planctomycetota bacterium]|nr:MAG: hypothetical protein D6731_12745 [Planctomycetota bacterium]